MSTITSPRDPSTPLARRMNSSTTAITPTSSSRPSLDLGPSSTSVSPNPNTSTTAAAPPRRANRAALREYYNLKKSSVPTTPTVEITNPLEPTQPFYNQHSDTLPADAALDSPAFNADAYVAQALEHSTLAELLRTYARVLGEMRALDAEKKALVYDNYSKLISATETIRRMRSTMDPLNPMASTLDLVVAKIYEQASGMREGLRGEVGPPAPERGDGGALDRRRRTRELAMEVLEVPARLRRLVEEGKEEEARREWEVPRRLLERWREKGLGGGDVDALIEEGDGIIGGLESPERSTTESST